MMTTGLLMFNKMQNSGYGCIISLIKYVDLKSSSLTSPSDKYANSKECIWRTCVFRLSVTILRLLDTDLFRSL